MITSDILIEAFNNLRKQSSSAPIVGFTFSGDLMSTTFDFDEQISKVCINELTKEINSILEIEAILDA